MNKPNGLVSIHIPQINMQSYERYLPTAFSDDLTMLEKVNKIIQYLYEYSEITLEMLTKWNEVYEWIMGDGLSSAVEDLLNKWLEDGIFNDIINKVIFGELNEKIAGLSDKINSLINAVDALKISFNQLFVNVKDFGAKGDGLTDDSQAIQQALKTYNNVYVPDGTYVLREPLNIRKNSHLKLHQNAILKREHNKENILNNYDSVSRDYNGQGNIIIEGGTFDCNGVGAYRNVANGIGLAHGDNIKLFNLTIKDVPKGHALELTGCKNILVDNVKFLGYNLDGSANTYVEAIQIEPALAPPIGANYSFPYVTDNTVTKDVSVLNCLFGPSDKFPSFPCGVGQHGAKYDIFYENIKIINNIFDGCSYWAIRPFKFVNCIISDNTIRNGNSGVYVVTPLSGESIKDVHGNIRNPQSIMGFTITDNIFENLSSKGIWVIGSNEATINDVGISGNLFNNVNSINIQLDSVVNSTVYGNSIKKSGGRALSISGSLNGIFENNVIDKVEDNAIFLATTSSFVLSNNLINNVKFYGFNIDGTCFDINVANNIIKNCSQDGAGTYDYIIISNGAKDIKIISNILRNEYGFNKPRWGLHIQANAERTVRYGNDLKCNAVTASLNDQSSSSITSTSDII